MDGALTFSLFTFARLFIPSFLPSPRPSIHPIPSHQIRFGSLSLAVQPSPRNNTAQQLAPPPLPPRSSCQQLSSVLASFAGRAVAAGSVAVRAASSSCHSLEESYLQLLVTREGDKEPDRPPAATLHMFPAEVSALAATGGPGAGRQAAGEAVAGGGVLPMLPPFFMGSIWPAGSEEDEAAAAAAAAAAHDRALAASRNHREAEKRRRERIKSHLDRLRNVLACDPKIDKASLLAKAVERVRDLKQRAAGVGEAAPAHLFPTEHDEIVVLASGSGAVFEASVCCDDRSDLLPDLIETLRALRLRTLRAEMATLGGRVRNVLVLARDVVDGGGAGGNDGYGRAADSAGGAADGGGGDFLKEALRALVERPGAAGDRPKRRRVSDMNMQAAA